jgi:hypothetical protein
MRMDWNVTVCAGTVNVDITYNRQNMAFSVPFHALQEHIWGCFKTKFWHKYLDYRERQTDRAAGDRRKVYNEMPHEFFPSQNITLIKLRMIYGGSCSMHRRDQQSIQNFYSNPESDCLGFWRIYWIIFWDNIGIIFWDHIGIIYWDNIGIIYWDGSQANSVCMFYSSPTRCTLYSLFLSWQRYVYMFRVLFAPIIRSTTAAYSHRFCMVWCVIALEQVLVWDSFTVNHSQLQTDWLTDCA